MFTKTFQSSAAPFAFVLFAATALATTQPASAAEAVTHGSRTGPSVGNIPSASGEAKAAPEVTIALREPQVPRARMTNRFVVTLEHSGGGPVSGADVRVTLYNAGVPGPKGFFEHPRQTTVRLREGERPGTYEGSGVIPSRGVWQASVAVNQHGIRVAKEATKMWAQ